MRCPSGVGAVSRRYGGRNSRRGVRPAKTAQGARKIIRLYVDFIFHIFFCTLHNTPNFYLSSSIFCFFSFAHSNTKIFKLIWFIY